MWCFVHFDLQMCFSLQRRAILPHLNFKKWSENAVFFTFWLANVLLATAACRFGTSELQKVVRTLVRFVHFDLKMCFSLQRRAIFHVPCQQQPPHPPLYRGYFSTQPTHKSLKNKAFRDFPNISRLLIFFLLTFAQLYLLSSDSTSLLFFFIFWHCFSALLFQLSILSEVRLLNFLRLCFLCRSLDFPSRPKTQKKRGRPAVAVHFFNDFTLKKSTSVALQASLITICTFLCQWFILSSRDFF